MVFVSAIPNTNGMKTNCLIKLYNIMVINKSDWKFIVAALADHRKRASIHKSENLPEVLIPRFQDLSS